jgi:HUS1 checkpoint protein
VPVRVLKLAELEDMAKEPMCPEPDVHIMLPLPSDIMRGVVERMKNLDSIIHVSANQEGVMKLRVQSDLANVETEWRGLSKPDVGKFLTVNNMSYSVELTRRDESDQSSQPVDNVDPSEFHTVAIEAKHLLKLLNALREGSHTIACKLVLCAPDSPSRSDLLISSQVYVRDTA